jgi:hypothetical protein
MAPTTPGLSPRLRLAAWAVALAVLLLVFAAYLDPHLVVDLAGLLWACF